MKTVLSDIVTDAFIAEWQKTPDGSKGRIESMLVDWYVKGNLSTMFDLRTPQQLWGEIFEAEDIRNFVLDTSVRLLFNLRTSEAIAEQQSDKDPHLQVIETIADSFSNPGYGPSPTLDARWFPQSGVVENSKVWLSIDSSEIEALLKEHSWLLTVVLILLFYENIRSHANYAENRHQQ